MACACIGRILVSGGQRGELRVERELACDDRVLAAGAPARDYAGHLLEIAHAFGGAPAPATALGMARARQLEHRLLAILDAARNRAALRRRGRRRHRARRDDRARPDRGRAARRLVTMDVEAGPDVEPPRPAAPRGTAPAT